MPEQTLLESLLGARDLDALMAARDRLDALDDADDEHIVALLRAWDDVPALANLLMHPELLPEQERLPALLRALGERAEPYLSLAAAVGLQRLADDPLEDDPADDPEEQQAVVVALEDLIATSSGVVAARAALALHVWRQEPGGTLPPLAAIPSYEQWRAAEPSPR